MTKLSMVVGLLTSLGVSLGLGSQPDLTNVPKPSTPVGAGYWAYETNVSRGGIEYTKLVVRDKTRHLSRDEIRRNTKRQKDELKKILK